MVRRAAVEALEGRRLMSFSPAVGYPVGLNPQAVAAADFNGDGRGDLAVVNNHANTVSVLLGNAGGTFQAALTAATGQSPRSVAVGDFNADGRADLAVGGDGGLYALPGNGNGTFGAPAAVGLGNMGLTPASVAVGDFNADGKLDLGAACNVYYPGSGGYYGGYPGFHQGHSAVLLDHGDGSFGVPSVTRTVPAVSGYQNLSAAVADFNLDGRLDFATAAAGYNGYASAGVVTVALGTGIGTLGAAAAFNVGSDPRSLAAGDVNGDGRADLVTADHYDGGVSVLLGDGLGGMAGRQSYRADPQPTAVAIADFNGDRVVDLVTTNAGTGTVAVLLGAGGGAFRPGVTAAAGSLPSAVAVGDFNGDGRSDVASASPGSSSVSILLNDGAWIAVDAPSIIAAGVSVTEGNTGTAAANFTVRLSGPSTRTVTVRYATVDGSATVVDGDYVAAGSTLLTFAPGETSKTVAVAVKGDRVAEATGQFYLRLSDATNAFLETTAAQCVILDNDPVLTIGDAGVVEGNAGTKVLSFPVQLSTAGDEPVTVNYSTAEGDTEWWVWGGYYGEEPPRATSGVDFQGQPNGTLTIPAGQTTGTINVVVNGDRVGEPYEVFSVNLIPANGTAVADGHAVGTIVDDEPTAGISGGGDVVEGNSGTKAVTFTVTLSNATDVPVAVSYATADGSATAGGGDYVAKSGTVSFAAGETSKTLTVAVNGDRRGEHGEFFYVHLTGATNAGVYGSSPGYGRIIDDEPRVSVTGGSITEGNSGTKLMTFTATLSAAYDQAVTVNYATRDGSAVAGSDYVAKSGTLTFAAGETRKTFTVSIKGDKQKEYDEYFSALLSGVSTNALIEYQDGWCTILNDEGGGGVRKTR
jgi:hypothetical protein